MIVGRGWEEMRADPREPIRATPPPEGPGALVLNVEAPSLGFDGGGVRGAFAAMLLDMVERAIQHRLGSSLPIGAYFQILAGTSTGAIIAGALASGMSAEKVSRFYQASGPSIFAKKRVPMLPGRKWRGIDDGAAYSAQPLEELLSDLIGGLQLSDLDYPLLATGYAMNSRGRRGPVIYYGGPGYCYPDDISLCDVIRSSTAAPTYFAPSEVEDTRGDVHMIVDGGLAANNPAYLGFLELKRRVRHLTPKPPIPPRYVILSIGTGADHNGRDPRVVRESPRVTQPLQTRLPLKLGWTGKLEGNMPRKRYTPEEIVAKLRQVEVLTAQGASIADGAKSIGITEQSYYRWRKEYGGLKTDQVKRIKELEAENQRLRKAVSDLTIDKLILKEAASGNY